MTYHICYNPAIDTSQADQGDVNTGKGTHMMTSNTHHDGEQEQFPESSGSSLPGNEDEVAYLLLQHRQLSELMGGVLPPSLEPSWGSRVLVIGWGFGGLVYEMAWRYPSLHITGIDANAHTIEEAQTLVRGLGNVTVFAQDMHHLNDEVFPPASFDLIQLRFLARNVTPQQYPPLMQSLARICRPGGLIVWTEGECPVTTSLACQRLCTMVQMGLQASGRAFTPGNSLGVTARMGRWLGDAGYRITQSRAYAIDISAGSTGHDAFVRQVRLSGEQLRTFLLEMDVTTEAEFEEIYLEMQREIQEEQFCGMLYLRMLVGVRS
jgi:SAM-dependent methyltransferase